MLASIHMIRLHIIPAWHRHRHTELFDLCSLTLTLPTDLKATSGANAWHKVIITVY